VRRRSGIITLTSDFGTRDAYVGAMKGVICSILPTCRIVDITHEIRPQKVLEAALLLEAAYPWFPPGTVHVVVVDPGVGTRRRPLAVEAAGQLFVGPDNGVLTAPVTREGAQVHQIAETAYELPQRSDTFHGRDVFAPAAGHLASGVEAERLGPAVADPVVLQLPRPRIETESIQGEVLRIDRFGNAISNIPRALLHRIGPGPYEVRVGHRSVGNLRRRYQDVAEGELLALTGGTGRIEVAVNGGSATEALGLKVGDPLEIRLGKTEEAAS
jgi:S-adenosylmethionine hydrolase